MRDSIGHRFICKAEREDLASVSHLFVAYQRTIFEFIYLDQCQHPPYVLSLWCFSSNRIVWELFPPNPSVWALAINSLASHQQFWQQDLYRKHGEHALTDVEGMPPVVIENHPVVFSDSQQPSAQRLEGKHGHGDEHTGQPSCREDTSAKEQSSAKE